MIVGEGIAIRVREECRVFSGKCDIDTIEEFDGVEDGVRRSGVGESVECRESEFIAENVVRRVVLTAE